MTNDSSSLPNNPSDAGDALSCATNKGIPGEPVEVQAQRSVFETAGEGDHRELVLVHGQSRTVIRYRMGEEAGVFKQIEQLAEDRTTGVDWYDAALMAHEMGKRLKEIVRHKRARAG